MVFGIRFGHSASGRDDELIDRFDLVEHLAVRIYCISTHIFLNKNRKEIAKTSIR